MQRLTKQQIIGICNFAASLAAGLIGLYDVTHEAYGFGITMLWVSGFNFSVGLYCLLLARLIKTD
jgi:uncharacterized membrane protein